MRCCAESTCTCNGGGRGGVGRCWAAASAGISGKARRREARMRDRPRQWGQGFRGNAPTRNRTENLLIKSQLLYQLSYRRAAYVGGSQGSAGCRGTVQTSTTFTNIHHPSQPPPMPPRG